VSKALAYLLGRLLAFPQTLDQVVKASSRALTTVVIIIKLKGNINWVFVCQAFPAYSNGLSRLLALPTNIRLGCKGF
jgi:hypothetical protein